MNPKEADALQKISKIDISQVKKDRAATIAEMLSYLCDEKPVLLKATNAMLTHLLRLADNDHCMRAGRWIVRRQAEMSWEYSVLLEIEQCEVLNQRPKKVRTAHKVWHLSQSDMESLDKAIMYWEAMIDN